MGNPDPAPDKVGPCQPPLNFVDANGHIVLRELVEARDCEVGWGKVMKAWGTGDEKVVAKNSIAFGESTSQRIYPEQNTPKIGWKLHKYGLQHALHTLDDHFR